MSACSAEFLAVHSYFNADSSIDEEPAPSIELVSSSTYPEGSESVPVQLEVSDPEGLHQSILFVRTIAPHSAAGFLEVKACRGLSGVQNDVVEFDYDGVIPSADGTSLSDTPLHAIYVGATDTDGNMGGKIILLAEIPPSHITTEELPAEVALLGNYPNPFNPETTIGYALPRAGKVRLVAYDLLGHEVTVLVDGSQPAGRHTVRFRGDHLPSGPYAYRLQAGDEVVVRTMILVKRACEGEGGGDGARTSLWFWHTDGSNAYVILASEAFPGDFAPMTLAEIQARLEEAGNADIAAHSAGFFRTGPGEYGEGDRFRGIRVPVLRKLARTCDAADMSVVEQLLMSPWHEDRLCALFMLIRRYERGDDAQKEAVFALYLKRVEYVNNWDLVDSSAHKIVGAHLESGEKRLLFDWVRDESLWKRRIAVIATYWYIKRGRFDELLEMAEQLLDDDQDLMHKAVGWMLREVGKKELAVEEAFLRRHYRNMPRTMLRYAIERFDEKTRKDYLEGRIEDVVKGGTVG